MGKMLYHKYVPNKAVFVTREIGNDNPLFILCFSLVLYAILCMMYVWAYVSMVDTLVDPTVEAACLKYEGHLNSNNS